MNLARMTRKRLGELLVDEGLLTTDGVREALEEQGRTGEPLGAVLVRAGDVSEHDIAAVIARQFSVPFLDLDACDVDPEVLGRLPYPVCQENTMCAVDRIGGVLTVAIGGLVDPDLFHELERTLDLRMQVFVATADAVRRTLRRHPADDGARPAPAEAVTARLAGGEAEAPAGAADDDGIIELGPEDVVAGPADLAPAVEDDRPEPAPPADGHAAQEAVNTEPAAPEADPDRDADGAGGGDTGRDAGDDQDEERRRRRFHW